MEERFKVLGWRLNAMQGILLANEEKAASVLKTKIVRLQTEYMGTRKTRVTWISRGTDWGSFSLDFVRSGMFRSIPARKEYPANNDAPGQIHRHPRRTILSLPQHLGNHGRLSPSLTALWCRGVLIKDMPWEEAGTNINNTTTNNTSKDSSTQTSRTQRTNGVEKSGRTPVVSVSEQRS